MGLAPFNPTGVATSSSSHIAGPGTKTFVIDTTGVALPNGFIGQAVAANDARQWMLGQIVELSATSVKLYVETEEGVDFAVAPDLTGTISTAVASTAVVGVGTLFLTELNIGDTIRISDGTDETDHVILTITDNLNLNVTVNWGVLNAGKVVRRVDTFTAWQLRVVDTKKQTYLEVGDENAVLSDHHKRVFYTAALTAPRTLTLSDGATLLPGERLLITDVAGGTAGAFSLTNKLTINGVHVLNTAGDYIEYMWTGSTWWAFSQNGYVYSAEAGSFPSVIEEFDNTAAAGPYFAIEKNSASPAAADALGGIALIGKNSADEYTTYVLLDGEIADPTYGSEDGVATLNVLVNGSYVEVLRASGSRVTFSAGFSNLGAVSSKTIAAGVITATATRTRLDTEAAAATDDLDTINGGSDGDLIILSTTNSGRDVVVKDGTGNLVLAGDFTLSTTSDRIKLIYDSTLSAWVELSRSDNA
jgi:hypothetical protein